MRRGHVVVALLAAVWLAALWAWRMAADGPPEPVAGLEQPWRVCGDGLRSLLAGCRIDINRTCAAELTLVPGIGKVLAGRIESFVAGRGRLDDLAVLDDVRGIGPALLARIGLLYRTGDRDGG